MVLARPEIGYGDYRLVLAPSCGGAIAAFEWRGKSILRPMQGDMVLNAACFPLAPFSNRIAHGAFNAHGREIRLKPNFPGTDHPHALHGYGWLSAWTATDIAASHATLDHRYEPGDWPWPYHATQQFDLGEDGLSMTLRLCNLGHDPMPAGLGIHPYFPRTRATRFLGLHRGEWKTGSDGLPISLDLHDVAQDWWNGQPVESRIVDTVYTGRQGPLIVDIPEKGFTITIAPTEQLSNTAVFVPKGEDFFCVEPVSHFTDAINSEDADSGMIWLDPGESMSVGVNFSVREL